MARGAHWWAPAGVYSRVVGRASRIALPAPLRRPAIGAFARAVGADLEETELALDEYGTLGEFFARRLRDGARPIDTAAEAVVAPADGLVTAVGFASDGALFQAKGRDYRLADLLADEALADELQGAAYVTVYLSPRDYHRVHTPIAAELAGWSYVPGARWPVGPRFADRVPSLYARNERAVARLITPDGPAAVVMVAAIGVGNLWLAHAGEGGVSTGDLRRLGERRRFDSVPHVPLARGDELGAFLLGSTVIALLPPGRATFSVAIGDRVRCGERIGGAR
jgi:phosphatidylserine decarboxylase